MSHKSVPTWKRATATTLDIITSPIQLAVLLSLIAYSEIEPFLSDVHSQLVKFDASLQVRWWKSAMASDASHITLAEAKRHLSHQKSSRFIVSQLQHYQENPPNFDLTPLLLLLDEIRINESGFSKIMAGFNPLPEKIAYRFYALVLKRISSEERSHKDYAETLANILINNPNTPPEIVRELRNNPDLKAFSESKKTSQKKDPAHTEKPQRLTPPAEQT